MALGTPTLATPAVSANSFSVVTASFTAAAGTLLLPMVGVRRGAATVAFVVTSSSGLSFVPLLSPDAIYDTGSGARIRSNVWAAMATGAAMTITWTSTGAVDIAGAVVAIAGASGIPNNVQSALNASGDPSVVLDSAPAASSCIIGFYAAAGTAAVTPPAGSTELVPALLQNNLTIEVSYDLTSPPTTSAWSGANNQTIGIVAEVQELAGVGGAGGFIQRQGQRQALLVR